MICSSVDINAVTELCFCIFLKHFCFPYVQKRRITVTDILSVLMLELMSLRLSIKSRGISIPETTAFPCFWKLKKKKLELVVILEFISLLLFYQKIVISLEVFFILLILFSYFVPSPACTLIFFTKQTPIRLLINLSFPDGSQIKESACNSGDMGSVPGLERSSGEGNGNPLEFSGLENPMDKRAWHSMGLQKSQTWLCD